MIAKNPYLIVPRFLYMKAIECGLNSEEGFDIIDGEPYWLGYKVYEQMSWVNYDC